MEKREDEKKRKENHLRVSNQHQHFLMLLVYTKKWEKQASLILT